MAEKREKIVPVLQAKNTGDVMIMFLLYALVEPNFYNKNHLMLGKVFLRMKKKDEAKKWLEKADSSNGETVDDKSVGAINFFASDLSLLFFCIKKNGPLLNIFFSFLWWISCNYLGVTQIEFSRSLVLIQGWKTHAIRANVNRPSKKTKQLECLPRKRLVQIKKTCRKKAPSRVLDLTHDLKNLGIKKHNFQRRS